MTPQAAPVAAHALEAQLDRLRHQLAMDSARTGLLLEQVRRAVTQASAADDCIGPGSLDLYEADLWVNAWFSRFGWQVTS